MSAERPDRPKRTRGVRMEYTRGLNGEPSRVQVVVRATGDALPEAVSPEALPNALRALESLRRDDPALVAWVEQGAPRLTDDEHVRRFGAPYRSTRSRKPQTSA